MDCIPVRVSDIIRQSPLTRRTACTPIRRILSFAVWQLTKIPKRSHFAFPRS